jgi:hypothetical protein
MEIKVSIGEVLDKLSILEIKKDKLQDPVKVANVQKEYNYLTSIIPDSISKSVKYPMFMQDLYKVNAQLWDIEEGKRQCERTQSFGPDFIQLARNVYIKNDIRAQIKKDINIYFKSEFTEEKSYEKY